MSVHRTGWPMKTPFVYDLNEDSTMLLEQIESVRRDVERGISLEQLQE
jgi:predicted DNA-binding protein (UPF0278 family)